MRKVIIADDENMICQMIVKMIDWKAKGLEVCGTANDGISVLNMIASEHPDILITDIRMPGLDGLELIRKAQALDKELSFIIISGYRSFDYAHTALTLGVSHYLLKPINEKELDETLDQIVSEKSEKENQAAARKHEVLEETRRQQRLHFLTEVIRRKGTLSGEAALSARRMDEPEEKITGTPSLNESVSYESRPDNGLYRALYVKVDTGIAGESYEMLDRLKYIEDQVFSELACEYLNSTLRSGIVSVLNYKAPEDVEIRRTTDFLFARLQHELDKFEDCSVTMGVGTQKTSIRDVADSIEEAATAIKCRIRKGCGKVIFYEELRYADDDLSIFMTPARRIRIEQVVESLDIRVFQGEMNEFNIFLHQKSMYHPRLVFDYLEEMENIVRTTLARNGVAAATLDSFHLRTEEIMDSQITTDTLLFQFINASTELFSSILDDRRQAADLPVRRAKQYMEEHFKEDIALDQVAAYVGWSSAYLSAQFRKVTGVGFNDYLTFLRLEKAKELLKGSSEPVVQIAEEVGYTDHRYFSRVFRKNVGLKPSEYRKLYQ